MTLRLDEPRRYPWRPRHRWAHLMADTVEELVTARWDLGLPTARHHKHRTLVALDHVDVREDEYDDAVRYVLGRGGVVTTSRDLAALRRRVREAMRS